MPSVMLFTNGFSNDAPQFVGSPLILPSSFWLGKI